MSIELAFLAKFIVEEFLMRHQVRFLFLVITKFFANLTCNIQELL